MPKKMHKPQVLTEKEFLTSISYSGPSAQAYNGGGIKFDAEKLPLHLIPPDFLYAVAEVLKHGASKYSAWNWTGLNTTRIYRAAIQHLMSWYEGEDLDAEWSLPHLAHAACCVMFLLWLTKHRPDQDDRKLKSLCKE